MFIMAKCVLTCVYAVAILLIFSAHGSEEINEVEVQSVAVRGSIYDSPYILSGKNLSFLPFFISGRERISFCIEVAGDHLNYSNTLQNIGFRLSDTIFLDNVSKEAVPWDCSREKNLTYFEENAAILSANYKVNLFIWDTYKEKIFHFKMNAREVPANDTSSMNTELTVRLAQPVNIEDVRVQVKWSLYFNEITIGRSPDDCRFKPNSYKWELNKNLWAPTINFDCKKAISLKDHTSYMNFTLRTPIWNFPLDNIQLKLDKGSTIFLQTATRGRERFPGVIKNINNRFYVNISSPVKDIKITFNDTLDMKLGEERLSIHKVLEPKENEALRVIYSLPSPLTKRSEINMSISRSHWLIEKISVIKASGELHATCKNTTNPCNDVLTVCNNGTCLCPKHYKEKKWRCLAPHAMPCSPDDGCITANAMCMNRTESDGITRWTCQCKQNETYIEADDKCSELYRTCNNITNPCKDLLVVCDNGTCLCPKYYKEKKWKCLAQHAMPCSPDDGCITANATCMNRTESDGITRWTCQCKQGEDYIEADDKCSGSISYLRIWAALLSISLRLIL